MRQFGIIIQARTGSKRFPNKILKKINKITILEFLIRRLLSCFENKEIFIATTTKKSDQKIVNIAKNLNLKFYRGSEDDVSLRYLNCAKKFKIKNIIRLTSDCPLIDPFLILKMKKKFYINKLDYLANTLPLRKSTFPNGSDIEIFKFKALKKSRNHLDKEIHKPSKEHVTNIFWRQKNLFKSKIFTQKINQSRYKFSLDYKSDFNLIKYIIFNLKKKKIFGNTNQIIDIIKNNKKFKRLSILSNKRGHKKRKDLI